jgi:hypothetical protein
MRQAFVHIGAHKTASSFLQSNLKQHQDRLLAEHALALVTRADLIPSAFGKEIYEVSQDRHPATEISEAAMDSLLSMLPDEECNLLITNEDLICHLDIQDFYQHAELAVRYLAAALSDFDLHVIFYVRKQADYLESIYMQYVHLGRRARFAQFMERAAPVDLSWLRAVEAMQRVLPPGRLHLRTFEQIRELGETGFYRDFLALCGVNEVEGFAVDENCARGRPANRSYGQLGMQIAQRVNPLLSPKEKKVFRRFLQEHFSTATHPRAVLLDAEQRQAMFDRYRESNQRLFEHHDLAADGRALGYF